jgi:hypothetical protein
LLMMSAVFATGHPIESSMNIDVVMTLIPPISGLLPAFTAIVAKV